MVYVLTGCKLVAATIHKQTLQGICELDCESQPIIDLGIGKPAVQPAEQQPTATVADLSTAPRNLVAPVTVQASPASTHLLTSRLLGTCS